MSEFKKVECTCSHGYTCRNMQDPNCCAHSCDYNDLVDAFSALKTERDAALAQNKRMKTFIRMTAEKFEGDHHVEPSMLNLMRVAKEVPDDVLADHDAEVAKTAVLSTLRTYGNTDLSHAEIVALAENYAAIFIAKERP